MEAKEVKATKASTQKKLSYEELENVANQLNQQARTLYSKLQEANLTNFFTRLDFLFRIVANSDKFDKEFVDSIVAEIQDSLAVQADDIVENDAEPSMEEANNEGGE